MAYHGILECYGQPDRWFTGITCTNGAGSPRNGIYAQFTDVEMQSIRKREQWMAASIGQYGAMIQLDYSSSTVKNPSDSNLKEDLLKILGIAQPKVIYTHNPADQHDTHIGVLASVTRALRELPKARRPRRSMAAKLGAIWIGCRTATRWS